MTKIMYKLLKISFFLSENGIISKFKSLHYLVNLIFVQNVSQNFPKKNKMRL